MTDPTVRGGWAGRRPEEGPGSGAGREGRQAWGSLGWSLWKPCPPLVPPASQAQVVRTARQPRPPRGLCFQQAARDRLNVDLNHVFMAPMERPEGNL